MIRIMRRTARLGIAASLGLAIAVAAAAWSAAAAFAGQGADPAAKIAALDTRYQAAVKANDAAAMSRILGKHMILRTGTGQTYTRSDFIDAARTKSCLYSQQQEVAGTQKVRILGRRTAVVTAELWEKGTCGGSKFDDHLWFSDIYVLRHGTWRYVFGQASRPI